jgi:hypothetical protein
MHIRTSNGQDRMTKHYYIWSTTNYIKWISKLNIYLVLHYIDATHDTILKTHNGMQCKLINVTEPSTRMDDVVYAMLGKRTPTIVNHIT